MTFTLVNKSKDVYLEKDGKKKNAPQAHLQSFDANRGSQKSTVVTFKNEININYKQKKESSTSKCDCLCFGWLFKKKSKEILLDNTAQNNSYIKNS